MFKVRGATCVVKIISECLVFVVVGKVVAAMHGALEEAIDNRQNIDGGAASGVENGAVRDVSWQGKLWITERGHGINGCGRVVVAMIQ